MQRERAGAGGRALQCFPLFANPHVPRTAVSERRRRRRRRRRLSLSALKQRSHALSDRQNRRDRPPCRNGAERRGGAQSLSLTLAALLPSRGRHYVFTFGLKQDGERRRTAVAAATDYKLLARRSGGAGEESGGAQLPFVRPDCERPPPPSLSDSVRASERAECVEWSHHYLLRVLRHRRCGALQQSPPSPSLSLHSSF